MSKHYSKVIEMESRGLNFVISLWKQAREQKLTSQDIHQRFLDFKEFNKVKEYPRYVGSYLQGAYDLEKAKAQHEDLEFCYLIDDELYSTHRDSHRYYEKHGFGPKEVYDKASQSGHFWKDTDKPYYIGDK